MIPPAFEYHAPASVTEAVTLLSRFGTDAKLLAGGHSLLPMMKLRFAQPGHLIDLNRIADLRGIHEQNGEIVIGAMTVENELLRSALLNTKVPLLPEAVRQIADPQVRNRGTIGGDLAHGDPANDHPALAIALDATLISQGPQGRRAIKAESFFHGMYATALAEEEVLCEIRLRPWPPHSGYAYEKLKRKTGDWATAAAAVVLQMTAGKVAAVRIALTNAAPTALRAVAAEQAVLGTSLDEPAVRAAAAKAMAICDPAVDLRGNREYKIAMTGEMVRRALLRAAQRCK
jgi:aerobic carbon-monoxide dehydrogenase medium subunit